MNKKAENKRLEKKFDSKSILPLIHPDPESSDQGFNKGFTGIVRTIQTYKHSRRFNDFRIITITMKNGEITDTKYSDPYGSFEVLHQLEMLNTRSFDHLNCNYREGLAFSK